MAEFRNIPRQQVLEPQLPVRSQMDEEKMRELEDSIRAMGVLQPLVVCPHMPEGMKCEYAEFGRWVDQWITTGAAFDVIAGHRRRKAAEAVLLPLLPCMVHPAANVAREAIMIHENACRENVNPADEAQFFEELIEKYDYTEEALCAVVKKSPAYIYSRLDLLRGGAEVLEALRAGTVALAVAKQLNRIKDAEQRAYYTKLTVEGGATARVVESWVNQLRLESVGPPPAIAAGPLPAAYAMPGETIHRCALCGQTDAPYNLIPLFVCKYEYEAFLAAMAAVKQRLAAGLPLG